MRAAIALPSGGRAARARLAAAVVAALVVLLPLGRLPSVAGGTTPSRHAVVLDNVAVGTADVVVRSVRHLPSPLPVPYPAAAVLPAVAVPILLFAICLPMWVLSRRARRAHLLTSAGRGPPLLS